MRSRHSICLLIALCWSASASVSAQTPAPPPAPEQPPAAPSAPAPVAEPDTPEPVPAEPSPTGQPAAADTVPAAPSATQAAEAAPSVPSPAEMESMLSQQLASAPPANAEWTAPAPVFTLHGYMRVRGELMDTFWLGRLSRDEYLRQTMLPATDARVRQQGPDPFTRFRPIEAREPPVGGCADEGRTASGCDVDTLRFANMRLRLSPELALSEDIRVKMAFDVFDNVILGEPPYSYYGNSGVGTQTVFADGAAPARGGDDLGDAIKPRRAWAEVRNRNLGELRFGRMPRSWGLGMYYNAGDGLDDDLTTDLDSVMGITKLAGIYLSAGYDFLGEGFFERSDERPLEQSQLDDVDQFTFSAARRSTPEELAAAHERGELVLNGGVQFSIRHQDSLYDPSVVPPTGMAGTTAQSALRSIDATHYTTDVWGQLRYRGFRLEAEVAWVTGSMDRLRIDEVNMVRAEGGEYDINQLGYALQTELRLVDDRLAIYFEHGLATGDSSVEGLSSGGGSTPGDSADFISQAGDDTVSTFRFHPSYRVDLILWRNIMRQVTGAYYFRPGISYDFVRSSFGQLAGARLDVIWSRASSPLQTWGDKADLGVEIDASLYFRTEDGPDFDDGFNAALQYGVLFPMAGLKYRKVDVAGFVPGDLHLAQTLRLVLGVVF